MSNKHTPGPWSVSPNEPEAVVTSVGDFYWFHWGHLPYQHEQYGINPQADARLISAAPEMLEALQALLTDVGRANSMLGAVKARAAIKKATGAE